MVVVVAHSSECFSGYGSESHHSLCYEIPLLGYNFWKDLSIKYSIENSVIV
jgi:hypothetical protein